MTRHYKGRYDDDYNVLRENLFTSLSPARAGLHLISKFSRVRASLFLAEQPSASLSVSVRQAEENPFTENFGYERG